MSVYWGVCEHERRCWGVTTSAGVWARQKGVLDGALKQELQAVLSIRMQVLKTKLGSPVSVCALNY